MLWHCLEAAAAAAIPLGERTACQRQVPVSYTHLDVYKRQVQAAAKKAVGLVVQGGQRTVSEAEEANICLLYTSLLPTRKTRPLTVIDRSFQANILHIGGKCFFLNFPAIGIFAVSYTHLDVYKRQLLDK